MANGSSFASLSRLSRRGVAPTGGAPEAVSTQVAPSMSIGAVDADEVVETPREALPLVKPSPFASLSRRSIVDDEPAARSYASGTGFSALRRQGASREVRRDINAVKLVTRLAQGIAFQPGSSASAAVKANALQSHVLSVRSLARDLAEAAGAESSNSSWFLAQCAEFVADTIARKLERGESMPADGVQPIVDCAADVLMRAEKSEELADALSVVEAAGYVEAADEKVAKDRIRISIAMASWDLYDAVIRQQWSYGKDPAAVVEMLVDPLLSMAREISIHDMSADLQVTHLQGTIRRLAGLMGAEYGAQTKKLIDWIDGAEGDAQRRDRELEACASLESTVVTSVHGRARSTLISIEKHAPRLLEGGNQEPKNQERQHGS